MAVLSNVEVVCWSFGRGNTPPTVAGLKETLAAFGLNPARVPEISDTVAFTRAAQSFKSSELRVTEFYSKRLDGRKAFQFDTVTEEPETGRLRRHFRCLYAQAKEGGAPEKTQGEEIPTMTATYETAKVTCVNNDLTKTVQNILMQDGLGVYTLGNRAGVYVVPLMGGAKQLLDKIGNALESLGARLLRYPVPDLAAQRAEISESVADSYNGELDTHTAAIAAYSESTPLKVVENRRESLNATSHMLTGVKDLLNGKYDALHQRIATLQATLNGVEEKIKNKAKQGQQAGKLAGKRLIVASPTPVNGAANGAAPAANVPSVQPDLPLGESTITAQAS